MIILQGQHHVPEPLYEQLTLLENGSKVSRHSTQKGFVGRNFIYYEIHTKENKDEFNNKIVPTRWLIKSSTLLHWGVFGGFRKYNFSGQNKENKNVSMQIKTVNYFSLYIIDISTLRKQQTIMTKTLGNVLIPKKHGWNIIAWMLVLDITIYYICILSIWKCISITRRMQHEKGKLYEEFLKKDDNTIFCVWMRS